jgi:putative endonuclease
VEKTRPVQTDLCYAYILRCADGTLYSGWTNDLDARVRAHNSGKGAKYTRARRPVELIYSESFETKSSAMKREAEFKKLSHSEKLRLAGTKPKQI